MSAEPAIPAFRLIVGLGNPGREYAGTRHNVGFEILDRLAAATGAAFHLEKGWKAQVARTGPAYLCKPQTYMNLSGEAVRAMSGFYQIASEQILIVMDDMALPLGKLRLRPSGSAGGHNGLKSVIEQLGSQNVARLRLGIGSADAGEAVGHVLGRFAPAELETCEQSRALALSAIQMAQTQGLAAAMKAYN